MNSHCLSVIEDCRSKRWRNDDSFVSNNCHCAWIMDDFGNPSINTLEIMNFLGNLQKQLTPVRKINTTAKSSVLSSPCTQIRGFVMQKGCELGRNINESTVDFCLLRNIVKFYGEMSTADRIWNSSDMELIAHLNKWVKIHSTIQAGEHISRIV